MLVEQRLAYREAAIAPIIADPAAAEIGERTEDAADRGRVREQRLRRLPVLRQLVAEGRRIHLMHDLLAVRQHPVRHRRFFRDLERAAEPLRLGATPEPLLVVRIDEANGEAER